jgi:hypothetical protein
MLRVKTIIADKPRDLSNYGAPGTSVTFLQRRIPVMHAVYLSSKGLQLPSNECDAVAQVSDHVEAQSIDSPLYDKVLHANVIPNRTTSLRR